MSSAMLAGVSVDYTFSLKVKNVPYIVTVEKKMCLNKIQCTSRALIFSMIVYKTLLGTPEN